QARARHRGGLHPQRHAHAPAPAAEEAGLARARAGAVRAVRGPARAREGRALPVRGVQPHRHRHEAGAGRGPVVLAGLREPLEALRERPHPAAGLRVRRDARGAVEQRLLRGAAVHDGRAVDRAARGAVLRPLRAGLGHPGEHGGGRGVRAELPLEGRRGPAFQARAPDPPPRRGARVRRARARAHRAALLVGQRGRVHGPALRGRDREGAVSRSADKARAKPAPNRAEARGHAPAAAPARGLRDVRQFLYVGALAVVVTRAGMMLWPLASEDAYITFRYARMAAAGHGLVYNLGERVMGFTSLPWVLWCTFGSLLHV